MNGYLTGLAIIVVIYFLLMMCSQREYFTEHYQTCTAPGDRCRFSNCSSCGSNCDNEDTISYSVGDNPYWSERLPSRAHMNVCAKNGEMLSYSDCETCNNCAAFRINGDFDPSAKDPQYICLPLQRNGRLRDGPFVGQVESMLEGNNYMLDCCQAD